MTKPSNFIINSDFATLKNDATGVLSLILPSSTSIPANNVASWTSDLVIGTPGSSIRSRINSTKEGNWYPLNTVDYGSTGATVSGSPTLYDLYVTVHRVSPTTIRLSALIPNQYPATMSVTGLSQTLTAYVATFLSPAP